MSPDHVTLNPLDRLVAVCDDTLRAAGQPGFVCVQAVELGGRLDADRLEHAARRLAHVHPLTTARLELPWYKPWPRWRVEPGNAIPVRVEPAASDDDTMQLAAERLNEPLDPWQEPPVQLFVHPRSDDTDLLVVKWSHVLTDARGGDFLMRELGNLYADDAAPDPGSGRLRPTDPAPPASRPFWPGGGKREGEVFRPWRPSASPDVRLAGIRLDASATDAVRAAAQRLAGFSGMPSFLLAAYFAAMKREAERAGRYEHLLRTCWPVSLREMAEPEAFPGNEYGLVYVECPTADIADTAVLVPRVARSLMADLGRGEQWRLWQTARWFRLGSYRPVRRRSRRSRFVVQGPVVTTDFRYRGRLLGGAASWGGLPVAGGLVATLCWPEKPIAVSLSETGGKLHVQATWLSGAIEAEHVDRILAGVREALIAASDGS